ncbi:DUF3618 domain-containing protein [Streptomyces millisiae]|uniref:DUF3618 domain-containing protein n=1 Tax=Streptomyces millisiae TaxID=3075542 RepID=A0ABU2LVI5_9ACTN|nr:DUF3618 domain-containing protein [Streptomyces sp. DSM 44918]MDT0321594.1 DUF3618 domain-containing protein [Streptomyces sp. DSM 44918]
MGSSSHSSDSPERIAREIEETRARLTEDLDRLADRVTARAKRPGPLAKLAKRARGSHRSAG